MPSNSPRTRMISTAEPTPLSLPPEEQVQVRRERDDVRVRRNGHGIQRGWRWPRLLRILVVDDNPESAHSLSLLLRIWGHNVSPALHGTAALGIAMVSPLDVVFLDLAMPGLDGYQVARRLRGMAGVCNAMFIALTGHADDAHRQSAVEAGFDHYLLKPIKPATLKGLLSAESNRLTVTGEAEALPNPGG